MSHKSGQPPTSVMFVCQGAAREAAGAGLGGASTSSSRVSDICYSVSWPLSIQSTNSELPTNHELLTIGYQLPTSPTTNQLPSRTTHYH